MPYSEELPSTEFMAEASTTPSAALSRASASWQRFISAGLKCSIMPTTGSKAAASPAQATMDFSDGMHISKLPEADLSAFLRTALGNAQPACHVLLPTSRTVCHCRVCVLDAVHTCLIQLQYNVLQVVYICALLILQLLSRPLPLHFPQSLRSHNHISRPYAHTYAWALVSEILLPCIKLQSPSPKCKMSPRAATRYSSRSLPMTAYCKYHT